MKGATIAYYVSWLAWQVSIHAPVKGATQSDTFVGDKLPVSIHAPVKGATRLGWHRRASSCCFNSRSREGSDSFQIRTTPLSECFNSRSREGSDQIDNPESRRLGSFNSRSREGSDINQGLPINDYDVSIHAPVKGATRHLGRLVVSNCGFNSRSREGSDPEHYNIDDCIGRFNSRSREGSDISASVIPCYL